MLGVGLMLKSLGIKVPDETITQIETLLPQLPQKINQLIAANGAALALFTTKLDTIIAQNQAILDRLPPVARQVPLVPTDRQS